jgi:prepilin-type N-terminal cleavage/methylation domain-containing protein
MYFKAKAIRAFSLIELLIVVSILLILSSLLSPTFTKIMENAQTTECKVNLKGVFQAVMLYAADNNDFLPGPSGERTGPHYYKIIRYNKKGDLSRRNKRFASFISPYVDSKVYDEKLDYIPSMICPANENMHELAGDPRIRPQYNILNPPGVAKPFGDHARTNVNGIFVEEKMPKQMSAINNPSDSKALKDARDAASRYATIPDLPVHQDFRENVLFFDGAVETQEVKLIP